MATRFYLSATATPSITPGYAAWTRTTEGARRYMYASKDGSVMTSVTTWANGNAAANDSSLSRQFISMPMAAGVAFSTSDTIKCYARCYESGTNDNINRQPICVKVYSEDGATLRATLKALGHIGPNTTEWVALTATNKTFADGDTLDTNYTTVDGDRLVVELGGQVSSAGGTSVTGTLSFGADAASDLGENETDTAANNPWFEISRTISFKGLYTEDFEQRVSGQVPAGFSVQDGAFVVGTTVAHGGTQALRSTTAGSVATIYRNLAKDGQSGNVVFEAWVYLEGATGDAEVLAIARMQTLAAWGSADCYYVDLRVSTSAGNRGVQLEKRVTGTGTVISSGRVGTGTDFVRQAWYKLKVSCSGSTIKGYAQRASDSNWLKSDGTWQATEIEFASVTDTSITGEGYTGILQIQDAGSGAVDTDDWSLTAAPSGDATVSAALMTATVLSPAAAPLVSTNAAVLTATAAASPSTATATAAPTAAVMTATALSPAAAASATSTVIGVVATASVLAPTGTPVAATDAALLTASAASTASTATATSTVAAMVTTASALSPAAAATAASTVTAEALTATALSPAASPLVTTDAALLAATALSPASAASATSAVSGDVATATALLPAAAAGAEAVVSAGALTATATSPASAPVAASTVSAIVATASALMPEATASGTGSGTVSAQPMQATATAPIPTLQASSTVAGEPVTASALSPAGSVGALATVLADVLLASALSPAGTPSATVAVAALALVATATAPTATPAVTTGAAVLTATALAVPATLTASANLGAALLAGSALLYGAAVLGDVVDGRIAISKADGVGLSMTTSESVMQVTTGESPITGMTATDIVI